MPRPAPNSSRLNDVCAVCLADLDVVSTKQTPCGHVYHEQCLVACLKVGTNCPTCRRQLIQRIGSGQQQQQQQPAFRQQLPTAERQTQQQQLMAAFLNEYIQQAIRTQSQQRQQQQQVVLQSTTERTRTRTGNAPGAGGMQAVTAAEPYTLY